MQAITFSNPTLYLEAKEICLVVFGNPSALAMLDSVVIHHLNSIITYTRTIGKLDLFLAGFQIDLQMIQSAPEGSVQRSENSLKTP